MQKNTDSGRRALRRDAVRGTLMFVGGQLLSVLVLLWLRGLSKTGWLDTLLLVLAVLDLAVIPFSAVVLRQRLREIEGGELDEALKY